MNYLLLGLLVLFVPCFILAKDPPIWLYGVENKSKSPITARLINVTCWNKGNFTTKSYTVPAGRKAMFKSCEDQITSKCSGAGVERKLFLNVTTPTVIGVVRLADYKNNCTTTIFVDGDPQSMWSGNCHYPEQGAIVYNPSTTMFMFGRPVHLAGGLRIKKSEH